MCLTAVKQNKFEEKRSESPELLLFSFPSSCMMGDVFPCPLHHSPSCVVHQGNLKKAVWFMPSLLEMLSSHRREKTMSLLRFCSPSQDVTSPEIQYASKQPHI